MHYLCEKCDNTCSGNKRPCRKCKHKKWLLVDDEGMVHIDLEFTQDEMNTVREATKLKYKLKEVTEKDMQRFIEERCHELADELNKMRLQYTGETND
jgi:DnaJ-class molecular chaperone